MEEKTETALAIRPTTQMAAPSLEPRTLAEAIQVAGILYKSGLLPSTVKSPEAAVAIIIKGRELGLTMMQSFAGLNIIQGKCEMSAQLMVGLVKKSALCRYFTLVECTDEKATWATKREDRDEQRGTFTMLDAKRMELDKKDNYRKQPGVMLMWRAAAALARREYPDVTLGLYVEGELSDSREQERRPVVVRAEVVPAVVVDQPTPSDGWVEAIASCNTQDELVELGKRIKAECAEYRRMELGVPYVARREAIKSQSAAPDVEQ